MSVYQSHAQPTYTTVTGQVMQLRPFIAYRNTPYSPGAARNPNKFSSTSSGDVLSDVDYLHHHHYHGNGNMDGMGSYWAMTEMQVLAYVASNRDYEPCS
jgi:hypothetical protein